MVKTESQFLIDAAFLVEKTSATFFGTPLLTREEEDHTFAFGFLRDFLRMKHKLPIQNGVVVFSIETRSDASPENLHDVLSLFEKLNIPCISKQSDSLLNCVAEIHSEFSHIVTKDRRLLQLCGDTKTIVLPRHADQREFDWLTPESMMETMGITAAHVVSFLALTTASKQGALTKKQARHLVESYGDLDSIFENLGEVKPEEIQQRLQENEAGLRDYCARNRIAAAPKRDCCGLPDCSLSNLDTENNRQVLTRYGFYSLVRLLSSPPENPF